MTSIRREIEQGRARAGNQQLRRLVAEFEPGADAQSERLLHRILRQGRLTGWQAQYRIELRDGYALADVAFPRARIAIEVDGRRHHDLASGRFEADRLRQNEIVALGWRIQRFTWAMLQDSDYVIGKISQLLAA